VRPNDIDIALIVHVLGAMVLVGGLVTAAAATVIGWRDESQALRRFAAMTLFAVALPGFIVMRGAAEWVASKEHLDKLQQTPTWLDIGRIAADAGGLLLLVALICGGIGMRRSRSGGGDGLLRASGALAIVLVAVYAVAVWAMGGKPG
jgi:hypothetical protein